MDDPDPLAQAVVGDVAGGDRERLTRQVHRIDLGMGEGEGCQNGQAAGAGAQVECRCRRSIGIVDPRRQLFVQQFGDEGTRHDDALVDIETVVAQPGFMGQVGGRQAIFDAALVDVEQGVAFAVRQTGVEEGFEPVERQVQGVQHQIGGFVPGVVGAVAEEQAGLVEAADREAQPVANGDEFAAGSRVAHVRSSFSRMRV